MPHSDYPKTELCLWRDQHDSEQVVIGSVTRVHTGLGTRKSYTAWLNFHVDALLYLVGDHLYDRVHDAKPEEFPLPINFTLSIDE